MMSQFHEQAHEQAMQVQQTQAAQQQQAQAASQQASQSASQPQAAQSTTDVQPNA
jgi:guanyl-specific ribonuclease Sa